MGARGLYVMLGVVSLVLLRRTGSTPVPTENTIPRNPVEMSSAQRIVAETPGDRTRRGGGDDRLLLLATSENLSGARLNQKRSPKLHPSTIHPIEAGLPEDRKGGRGDTESVVIPSISHHTFDHKLSSRRVRDASKQSGNPENVGRASGGRTRSKPSGSNLKPREPAYGGSVSAPFFSDKPVPKRCPIGKKRINGKCRTTFPNKQQA